MYLIEGRVLIEGGWGHFAISNRRLTELELLGIPSLTPVLCCWFERYVCSLLERKNTRTRSGNKKIKRGLLMCRTHSWLATARSEDQVLMEVSLRLNGKLRVAGCLVARARFRLFICRAYSRIATSRSS